MIEYKRELKRKMLSEKEGNAINSFYPLSDAVFIPYIKEEFRNNDKELKEAGCFNDNLINDILSSLNTNDYLGTYQHTDDFYSDYFESKENFINILYYEENNLLIIGAIFVTTKNVL